MTLRWKAVKMPKSQTQRAKPMTFPQGVRNMGTRREKGRADSSQESKMSPRVLTEQWTLGASGKQNCGKEELIYMK